MKYKVALLVLAVLTVLFVWRMQGVVSEARAKWEADVARVQAQARAERARADSVMERASKLEADAGRQSARASSLEQKAKSQAATIAALRNEIASTPVPVSDTIYTAPRDRLILALTTKSDTLDAALQTEKGANEMLRHANASLRTTVTRLSESVDSLNAVLDRRPHERWWVPALTVGASAGVDAGTRKLFAGPAVSLGWKLKL